MKHSCQSGSFVGIRPFQTGLPLESRTPKNALFLVFKTSHRIGLLDPDACVTTRATPLNPNTHDTTSVTDLLNSDTVVTTRATTLNSNLFKTCFSAEIVLV